jgi:hypothetical protein
MISTTESNTYFSTSKTIEQDKPIFIGGLQRSGTSLVRAILGSHPTLAIYKSDLPLWTKFYKHKKDLDLNNLDVTKQLLDEIVSDRKTLKIIGLTFNTEEILETLKDEPNITFGILFKHLLKQYAKLIGRPRWGLKTPHNEFWTDDIFAAYPDAKMIHLIRDPRDVAVSVESRGWDKPLEKTCKKWQQSAQLAKINKEKYAGAYIVVRYEDLVRDPESIIKQVCQVVELDYTPDMLKMDAQLGWRGSNSHFEDLGYEHEGISEKAIARYKEYLSPTDQEFIEDYLKDEMIQWQYFRFV